MARACLSAIFRGPRLGPADRGWASYALKWSAVSAADATLFQAPFRAGIKLMAHQLTPLMKALELPRANLFTADDVGLGKTIEAGLVLQELILRQQASFVLVVCPASVCLQWQGEMQRRFGLRFEVMTRQFVAYRRQERGFGTNPWSTHSRFIVSHALLRRPEHRDPLLHHLGERARKGLLILDEAHVAAPASASKYATDTDITRTIRDLAPRFDNRLFLSATPHNGHSNSFSALLEILDPVRFTRGVPVDGKKDLDAVMVRRLKRDLRKLGAERFPRRLLVQLSLRNDAGQWRAERRAYDAETGEEGAATSFALGGAHDGEPTELALATKLARYTELCAPVSGQGRFPFICLQQRLLSSPEAFARTLQAHAQGVNARGGPAAVHEQADLFAPRADETEPSADPELHGISDEARAEEEDADVRAASLALSSPTEEARALLSEMRALAEKARRAPDAKALALLAWLREHLCPAIGLGEDTTAKRTDPRPARKTIRHWQTSAPSASSAAVGSSGEAGRHTCPRSAQSATPTSAPPLHTNAELRAAGSQTALSPWPAHGTDAGPDGGCGAGGCGVSLSQLIPKSASSASSNTSTARQAHATVRARPLKIDTAVFTRANSLIVRANALSSE